MLLNTLDATMINVALSTLAREFHVSPAAVESVVIGYLVSLAVFIPASGWLGDRFGSKRTFLIALTVFTVASIASGFATSLQMLVGFRVMQGVGGGMLTPVGMAMLYRTFPPQERVAVSRVLMFAIILGPALGPIIGGAILASWSWPWIFFAKVPLAVAALLFGLLFLNEHREQEAGGFDLAGFLLAGVGFSSVMYALSQGPQYGWIPMNLSILAVGLCSLVAFVLVELGQQEPMIDLRLLENRLFRTTITVSFFGSAAFLGVLFMVPIFLQEVVELSPLQTGISVAPEAVGVIIATQLVARIYPNVGPRRLMMSGLTIAAAAILLMASMHPESNIWLIRGFMFTLGTGMAFIFLPNQVASLATISRRDTGRATTLTNVQRQLGSALGVALLSTVLSSMGAVVATASGATMPNLAAYRAAFFAAAGVALIGALVAWRVPDEEASETMARKGVTPAEGSAATRTPA
jgi:EmrB/QacA subfamily drug resistance transporter